MVVDARNDAELVPVHHVGRAAGHDIHQAGPSQAVNVVRHTNGLYQLIIVRQENQDHSFVSKPVPLVREFARFCNDVVAGSFDEDARSVDFGRLDDTPVKATALFGYTEDVWKALVEVGLDGGPAVRDSLQEGLLVWCPWLAAATGQDADAMSTDSWQLQGMDTVDVDSASLPYDERRMYVAAWAGDAVAQPGLHPPFNLTLRLLVALCPDIIIPVSADAAAAFDGGNKPFESGEGITEDYSVQQHTSANTDLQVGDCKRLKVQVDPRLWQTGAVHEHVTDVSANQVALSWHSGAKGATLVSAYHAMLTCIRTEQCKASAPQAPNPKKHKVELCPKLISTLQQQVRQLQLEMQSLMPGRPAAVGMGAGKAELETFFGKVLQHPAVLLLQQWYPEVVADKAQELQALKEEVVKIVLEEKQRNKRLRPPAEADQQLHDFLVKAIERLMQRWFGAGITDNNDMSSVEPRQGQTPSASGAGPSQPRVNTQSQSAPSYRDMLTGNKPKSSALGSRTLPLDMTGVGSCLSKLPTLKAAKREQDRLLMILADHVDREFIIGRFAEPFAWEALLKQSHRSRTSKCVPGPTEFQTALTRIAWHGAPTYMRSPKYQTRMQKLGTDAMATLDVTVDDVLAHVRRFLNDGEPSKVFKALLQNHTYTEEIIALCAVQALRLVPEELRMGESGATLPQAVSLFELTVELIASWMDFELKTPVSDMVQTFSGGSLSVIGPFLLDRTDSWEPDVDAEMSACHHEAVTAGFSRYRICHNMVSVAVMQQHVPEPYCDYFKVEDAIMHGPLCALQKCQSKHAEAELESQKHIGVFGRVRRMLPGAPAKESESDRPDRLDINAVRERSSYHAKLLMCGVKAPESLLLGVGLRRDFVQQMCWNEASRLFADLLVTPETSFPSTKKALDAHREQQLESDLQQRSTKAEGHLIDWMAGVSEDLHAAVKTSFIKHGEAASHLITQVNRSQTRSSGYLTRGVNARESQVELVYEYQHQSSAFGNWSAQVLCKSAQGEDAEVTLDCEVVHHEERLSYVEMLGVAAGPASSLVISVRMIPTGSPHMTEVFVHPKSQKASFIHHRKVADHRPVLAARYEPSSRILALLLPAAGAEAGNKHAVAFYAFTPDFRQLQKTHDLPVTLQGSCAKGLEGAAVYNGELPFVLLPAVADSEGAGAASKMALILEPDRVRVYNILVKTCEPESLAVSTAGKQWLCTPCRTALLAVYHDRGLGRWVVDAYALEDAGTAQALFWQILEDEALPDEVAQLPPQGPRFTVATVDGDTFLLAANGNELYTTNLKLQSINVENTLAKHGAASDTCEAASAANRLLNYVHSCCLRFPVDDCLGLAEAAQRAKRGEDTVCRTVRLHIATPQEEQAQVMVEYTQALLQHALHTASQKPSGRLLALEPCSATSVLGAASDVKAAAQDFGRWMRTAMCLLPLQLSRCMGNSLEPMHDGEPRRGVEASAADGDIDGMARTLRLGLYESVLASHTGPVKFVCALGQQSMGKSYQLNHLGGTLFDVAGGRCTDGVWLSARFMRDAAGVETVLVFLDCEGIGSPQRHEVEDMLHCLLVGAVSSLTMFKTHFAFTTELMETLKRINKGAERVADICGSSGAGSAAPGVAGGAASNAPVAPPTDRRVFRGSIMFCLKDVSPDAMRSTVRDFNKPLNSMVRSGDNFVSAIYNNKLSISAFPGLSGAFYTTLQRECVSRLQSAVCPSYASGADAAYTLKMMIMKVAHKDWTAIHRQLIVSKAKVLRALMPAVVHHGCEATLKHDGAPLGPALPLHFSGTNKDAPSSEDLQAVTFNVTLPAYVHTAVQSILQAAAHASNGALHIQPVAAAAASVDTTLGAAPFPNTFAHGAGLFPGAPLAEAVGEAVEDDEDDASSMGASGFGEPMSDAPASGFAGECVKPVAGDDSAYVYGAAAAAPGPSNGAAPGNFTNRFAMLSAQMASDDTDMEGAQGDRDGSMLSGTMSIGGDDDIASADEWAADMRNDLLGSAGFPVAGLAPLLAAGGHASLSPPPPGMADGAAHMHEAQQTVRLQWTVQIPDQELRLGSLVQGDGAEGVAQMPSQLLQEDAAKLRAQLVELLGLERPDKDANQFRLLHAALRACVQALLARRRATATAWLEQAAEPIRDTPEASELQSALLEHLRRQEDGLHVCGAACASCLLPCWALGAHSTHSCGTDHHCKAACDFCSLEPAAAHSFTCSGKAGHHGRHMCSDRPHACGKPCALSKALNCNGGCAKVPQHEGPCDCECGNHLCGAPCSLPGCGERCKEPWGSEHKLHACGATACPEKCPLCGNGCPEGHFHALEQPKAHHLCGKEHSCMQPGVCKPKLCAQAGGCSIEGTIERIAKKFKGKRDEFEYDAVTRQNMPRKVCTVMVPPGKLTHDGPCSCGRSEAEHYCGHPCPQCLYRCTKAVGHEGRHRAPHGNLENSLLVASTDEFDLKDRKYAVGDSAQAETCDSFCTNCGRGHLHYVRCDKAVCESALHDCARHSTQQFVDPDGAVAKGAPERDELTHDFHWQQMNFEDPVKTADDLRLFRMCGNYCTCEEHLQADGTLEKKYCLLPLWHAPLNPRDDPAQHKPEDCMVKDVFISEDGCLLPCKHVTASDVHTFLVIDRSGSMGSHTIRPDSNEIRHHPRFASGGELDTVLGVVYEAAHKYILERTARAPRDLVTFIPFHSSADIDFAGWHVRDSVTLLDRLMQTGPGGGTNFGNALFVMQQAVTQWRAQGTESLKPVAILLTDSEDWVKATSVDVLRWIMEAEAALPEAERLTVHVIGFGPGVDEGFIQQLAAIGRGSHFTCQAARDMDRTNLVRAFSRIASRPADQVALVPS
eukprot:jgi/Ulvmu1/8583/UM045_0026.1